MTGVLVGAWQRGSVLDNDRAQQRPHLRRVTTEPANERAVKPFTSYKTLPNSRLSYS